MNPQTLFLLIAAVMIVAACASLVVPLVRTREQPAPLTAGALIAVIPLTTLGLYLAFSNWTWEEQAPHQQAADPQQAAALEQVVGQLEQRLRDAPDDIQGWVMLGRSYVVMGRYTDAVQAYRQARTLSDDQSVEAITGYAEALAVSQGNSIGDESMALFERALQMSPDDRKGLWYGGLGALQRGDSALARQRWQRLLQLNPPEQMAQLLREQIALTQTTDTDPPDAPVPQGNATTLTIAVALDEALRNDVPATAPLFVLARPSGGGGPPLAVVRRSVADLPLTLKLTDADAMMQGRELSAFDEVEVVARIALGGTPVAQPGDLYGSLVTASDATISIVIDKVH